MRGQTPKIVPKAKKRPIPRIRNIRNYEKRLAQGRKAGQNWVGR